MTKLPTTKQEMLNQAVKGICDQGEPGWDGGCLYRTDQGLKCAVGCLIPDEIFSNPRSKEAWNTRTVATLIDHVPQFSDWKPEREFLIELQLAHDEAAEEDLDFKEEFEKNIKKLSAKFGLEVPEFNWRS